MLDNKFLEALAAVVEEGGFDKAASRLHITQSAVSQRVRGLEEQVGRVLVARISPPQATAAGQELIKHLRKVRLLEQELAAAMGIGEQRGFVTLPIGVNADSLATWFLDAVQDFLREERVLLDICVDDENRTHELLRRGEVVGCLGARAESPKGCRSDLLGEMDYLCVCTPGFRDAWFGGGVTLENLAEAPVVLFNRKDETHGRMLARAFPGCEVRFPHCYVPSSESFADYVLRGLAFGMVPAPQSRPHLATGRLVELLPLARVPVALYWHSWNVDAPVLVELRKVLLESFASQGEAMRGGPA